MNKLLFALVLILYPGQVLAENKCIANFNSKDYAKDKDCIQYTTEQECLSAVDDLNCDWKLSYVNPAPPAKAGKCYPSVPKNGSTPNPEDGQCLMFKKQTDCESKIDKFNCFWHEKNKTVTGCIPNGTSAADGSCNKYSTLEMCLSTQDNRNCKWINPGSATSSEAAGSVAP